jgi:hypothetical protein
MTLLEAVRDLDILDEESTIYASEPWTKDSIAIVDYEPAAGGLPIEAERLGLQYFLEVSIARDFIEDWAASSDAGAMLEQQCARLIVYAITDA